MRTKRKHQTISVLILALCLGTTAMATPSLDATASGFYGVSQALGPFGRADLIPSVIVDPSLAQETASFTTGNVIQHDTSGLFTYAVNASGYGTVTWGKFNTSLSFGLSSMPQTAIAPSGPTGNEGHAELVSHIILKFSDRGVITSRTLAPGTPVTVRFTVVNTSTGSVNEPAGAGSNNPHDNGYFAGVNSSGYLQLFDENTFATVDPAPFFEKQTTVVAFNTRIGDRVDVTANYTINGNGYAGLDGSGGPFFPQVSGKYDAITHLYVQGAGVSFVADSGHNYAQVPPHFLSNISTRGAVGTGDNAMIGGFGISGSGSKLVLLRALGPTLGQSPFNVAGALADPVLELHGSNGSLISSNGNWGEAVNRTAIIATGLAPPNPAEAAILTSLSPGNYTVVVRGASNTTGIGLVDCYDLDDGAGSQLRNISTRGFVLTGDKVLIAGVVVKGPGNEKVVIRGLGPTLGQAPFNVPNSLADPFLDLRDGNGNRIMVNNNWADTQAAQIQGTGYAPPNAAESAIDVTLVPGNYTVILSGVNNTAGNGLIEVYALN